MGDLLDLIPALVPGTEPPLGHFKLPGMGRCSALIKVRGHSALAVERFILDRSLVISNSVDLFLTYISLV